MRINESLACCKGRLKANRTQDKLLFPHNTPHHRTLTKKNPHMNATLHAQKRTCCIQNNCNSFYYDYYYYYYYIIIIIIITTIVVFVIIVVVITLIISIIIIVILFQDSGHQHEVAVILVSLSVLLFPVPQGMWSQTKPTPPGISAHDATNNKYQCPRSVLGSSLPVSTATLQNESCSIRFEAKIIVVHILHIFLCNYCHLRISCFTCNILFVSLFHLRSHLITTPQFVFIWLVQHSLKRSVQSRLIIVHIIHYCTFSYGCNILLFSITYNMTTKYIVSSESWLYITL